MKSISNKKVLKQVKCVDNKLCENYLTKDKLYDVININHDSYKYTSYKVVNDEGDIEYFYASRFIDVKEDGTLSVQEVVQAILDGKELEIQYTDGTWRRVLEHNTTLHQLINLKFRLKPKVSLEEKRKAVIKKLLTTKVAVLCKCWDSDEDKSVIMAVRNIDENDYYAYIGDNSCYKNAFAIDDNGNEIT